MKLTYDNLSKYANAQFVARYILTYAKTEYKDHAEMIDKFLKKECSQDELFSYFSYQNDPHINVKKDRLFVTMNHLSETDLVHKILDDIIKELAKESPFEYALLGIE